MAALSSEPATLSLRLSPARGSNIPASTAGLVGTIEFK